MTIKVRSEDGAVGKSIRASRKKVDDNEQTICEIRVQMTVTREQFAQLAGVPYSLVESFYGEEGLPLERMSLLLTKRELAAHGKLTRGEGEHTATLEIKKATAVNLTFVPEPNMAVFICKLSWIAAGDEVEDVKDLLGCYCNVDMTFKGPAEQRNLSLVAGKTKSDG